MKVSPAHALAAASPPCKTPHVHDGDSAFAALEDAELVARIRDGQDRARAEATFCARYQRRVYLYGIRHLRDAAAADDLVQEVLSTVIQRLRGGAVEIPEQVGSFVLGTCRMQVINRRRGERRRARLLAQYGDPRVNQQLDSEIPAVDSATLERVRNCLARLLDRDRAVLLLTFYAEMTAAAAGGELGVDAGHARVLRHRALARLQACVKGAEVSRQEGA